MTLNSRLAEIAASLPARIDVALREGAELVRDRAEGRAPDQAPFGEGLPESIHVAESLNPHEVAVVAGNKDVFYGHMVELGTTHSAPHPFLVPALEESRADIIRAVKLAVDER